jgi:hypothetical protein
MRYGCRWFRWLHHSSPQVITLKLHLTRGALVPLQALAALCGCQNTGSESR